MLTGKRLQKEWIFFQMIPTIRNYVHNVRRTHDLPLHWKKQQLRIDESHFENASEPVLIKFVNL